MRHRRRINLAPFKSSISPSPLPYGVWLIKARLDNNPFYRVLFNFVRLTARICIVAAAVCLPYFPPPLFLFFFLSVFVHCTRIAYPALPNSEQLRLTSGGGFRGGDEAAEGEEKRNEKK